MYMYIHVYAVLAYEQPYSDYAIIRNQQLHVLNER